MSSTGSPLSTVMNPALSDLFVNIAAELESVKRTQAANHAEMIAKHAKTMASNERIEKLLEQVIMSQAARRQTQSDSGYSTSARATPSPPLQEDEDATEIDLGNLDWEDNLDISWMKPRSLSAPRFRPVGLSPEPGRNDNAAAQSSNAQETTTAEVTAAAAVFSLPFRPKREPPEYTAPESSTPPIVDKTLDTSNAATSDNDSPNSSLEVAKDASASDVAASSSEPMKVTETFDSIEAAEPTAPAHVFPFLQEAIAIANPAVLSAHVVFPKPHSPLPIDNIVESYRIKDLGRVHEVLLYYATQYNMIEEYVVEERAVSNLSVIRSLSCAIEHFAAIRAKDDEEGKVGTFIGREMKAKGGVCLSGKAIEDLADIVENWFAVIQVVKNVQELMPALLQDAAAQDVTTQNDLVRPDTQQDYTTQDFLDEMDTEDIHVAPQNASTQAVSTQGDPPQPYSEQDDTAQEPPEEMDASTDIHSSQQNANARSQQNDNTAQPNLAPIAVTSVQPIASVMIADKKDEGEDTPSKGKLLQKRLRPILSIFPDLNCISSQTRGKAVVEFARILEAKNARIPKCDACRLSGDDLFKMARQIETRIMMLVDRLVQTLRIPPSSQQIFEEYIIQGGKKLDKYHNGSPPKFLEKVKKFHQLSVKTLPLPTLNEVRAKLVVRIKTKISTFGSSTFRHRNRPRSPTVMGFKESRVTRRKNVVPANSLKGLPNGPLPLSTVAHAGPLPLNNVAPRSQSPAPSVTLKSNGTVPTSSMPTTNMLAQLRQLTLQKQLTLSAPANVPSTADGGVPRSDKIPAAQVAQPQQPTSQTLHVLFAPSMPPEANGTVPTSDKLTASRLAKLQQPASQTPPNLSVPAKVRGDTIVDFYDSLVNMNTSIPRLAKGLDVDLLEACMDAFVAPFWNDFVPLSASQLTVLAKQIETEAVDALNTKMQGKTLSQTKQQMEYHKAATMFGPSSTPKGMEKFAKMVKDLQNEVVVAMTSGLLGMGL